MTKKIQKISPDRESLLRLRFLVLDVDGVLTDGSIPYTSTGEELKTFDVKDQTGIKYWLRAGHAAGIISGRSSRTVQRYAQEVGIQLVATGAKDKLPVFQQMLSQAGVTPEETVMLGDDLPDYPLVVRAGLGVAVADAVHEVKEAADLVTERAGGRGAVRETIEYVLRAQDRWNGILERYLTAGDR